MAKGTKTVLARADIQSLEHTLLQERVSQQAKQDYDQGRESVQEASF
jgi:hypothetical protein